jgi:hypothetical protein
MMETGVSRVSVDKLTGNRSSHHGVAKETWHDHGRFCGCVVQASVR